MKRIEVGDWHCPNCNMNIFKHKTECKKCKYQKQTFPQQHRIVNNDSYNKSVETLYAEIYVENDVAKQTKMQQAMDEGKPVMFYVTNCSICKNTQKPKPHNCWKYS